MRACVSGSWGLIANGLSARVPCVRRPVPKQPGRRDPLRHETSAATTSNALRVIVRRRSALGAPASGGGTGEHLPDVLRLSAAAGAAARRPSRNLPG
jgi:hypothetical protein